MILHAGIIQYMRSRISYTYLNLVDICVLDCSYAPQGDKYKVAKRWGHIHIVIRKWFDQSIARRGNFYAIMMLYYLSGLKLNSRMPYVKIYCYYDIVVSDFGFRPTQIQNDVCTLFPYIHYFGHVTFQCEIFALPYYKN